MWVYCMCVCVCVSVRDCVYASGFIICNFQQAVSANHQRDFFSNRFDEMRRPSVGRGDFVHDDNHIYARYIALYIFICVYIYVYGPIIVLCEPSIGGLSTVRALIMHGNRFSLCEN